MKTDQPILNAMHIVKRFGGVTALDGVDLTVNKGEIRGLIGPNGSGKTTMFNVLTGYAPATEGTVELNGKSVESEPTHRLARRGIARTFQHIELFRGMSVLDNVMVAAQCGRPSKLAGVLLSLPGVRKDENDFRRKAEEELEFVGIGQYKDMPANGLAYGQQRLVEIARALATGPELLLLDEPAAGMNPTEKQQLVTLVRAIRDRGITVIIIDHDMKMISDLADYITVLDCGKKIAEGYPEEIQNNETVIKAYLGSGQNDEQSTASIETCDAEKKYAAAPIILELSGVNTYYGAVHVLRDINFNVKDGEFVSLIGANGAGKTTLLKTISGMIAPKQGSISFRGAPITGKASCALVKQGLVHVPEGRGIFSQLSVKENIYMGAYLRSDKAQMDEDYEYALSLFPRLRERITQQGGSLSGGEQQMLAIARAMMSRPQLLLLDEPSMGLSPKYTEEVFKVIRKLHEDGHTIILVEQNAKAALSAADRGFVIEVGKIVLEGPAKSLLNDPKVRSAYLGG